MSDAKVHTELCEKKGYVEADISRKRARFGFIVMGVNYCSNAVHMALRTLVQT